MITVQNIYVEPETIKSNEPKRKMETNREGAISIKRNFNPSTVLEMRFARLRKVMRKRSSSIF